MATPTLGSTVTYVSSKGGHEKAAIVIGTPETIAEGTSVPTLGKGELHLLVINPAGKTSVRQNVASLERGLKKGTLSENASSVWK